MFQMKVVGTKAFYIKNIKLFLVLKPACLVRRDVRDNVYVTQIKFILKY